MEVRPSTTDPLHSMVGAALEAYARVEGHLTSVLQDLIRTNSQQAHAIFFAVQNVRSRNDLFETLLLMEIGPDIRTYWASCSTFLYRLALFRNAIAHWGPLLVVYMSTKGSSTKPAERALRHPAARGFKPLLAEDIKPCLVDCQYMAEELSALHALVTERPSSLPERFLRRLARRNSASLQQSRSPKGPQPQRRSSRRSANPKGKKLSAKQRRLRAIGIAARKPKTET